MTISPPYKDPSHINWRLNPSLLSSPPFVDNVSKELKQLISENKSPEASPTTIWEAAKAYLLGAIISYTSAQKKKALKSQLDLKKKIKELEEFRSCPSKSIGKQLDVTCSALNQLLTRQAETSIFFAKHRLYKSGNKPCHVLAHLAKGRRGLTASISVLQDSKGVSCHKSTEINSIMKAFHQNLYISDGPRRQGKDSLTR